MSSYLLNLFVFLGTLSHAIIIYYIILFWQFNKNNKKERIIYNINN